MRFPYLSYKESNAGKHRMIFAKALDTHELIRATETGQRALCPDQYCNCIMMSRCSDIEGYTKHWYGFHDGKCDSHYEPMSEWHSNWQNTILNPIGGVNVEVPIIKGRYKRADLKPNHGIIIEFQKSSISYRDVKEREHHYKKMIWVLHEERTTVQYTRTSKKHYPKRAWSVNRNPNIPIFIDHDGYLTSDSLPSGTINKERFIAEFINSDHIDYDSLNIHYIPNITLCFEFFNSILIKIKVEENRILLENRRLEKLEYDLMIKKLQEEEYERQQRLTDEERYVSEQTQALFTYFIQSVNHRVKCWDGILALRKREETERLHFKDPQYLHDSLSILEKQYEDQIAEANEKHRLKTEEVLQATLKFENWKQKVKKIDMPALEAMNPTPVIEARIKCIETLELQLEEFEKKGIPTFKTETEILKLKRELSNLSRVKA